MTVTIETQTPNPPKWVNTAAGRIMWQNNLEWRCDAARATTQQYRRVLLRVAERVYGEEGQR